MLGFFALVSFIAGLVLLFLGPYGSGQPTAAADVATASATALGVSTVVVSVISLPHSMAAGIAPGFSSAVNNKNYPWVAGAYLVCLTLLLFIVALQSPGVIPAVGAASLCASGLFVAWLISRLLLSSTDLLQISIQQAKHLERSAIAAEKFYRRSMSRLLPKDLRTKVNIEIMLEDQYLGALNGMLRQCRSGINAALAAGHSQIVPTYWQSMVGMIADYARRHEGRIGGYEGPAGTLASTYIEIVTQGLAKRGETEATAVYCTNILPDVDVPEATDAQFNVLHQRIQRALREALDSSYTEDWSQLPSATVSAGSRLLARSISADAKTMALSWQSYLEETFKRARSEPQAPIATHAFHEYLKNLEVVLQVKDRSSRRFYLQRLFNIGPELASIEIADVHGGFGDGLALLVPGLTFQNLGLQLIISTARFLDDAAQDLEEILMDMVLEVANILEARDDFWRTYASDLLAVAHFLSITLASRGICAPSGPKLCRKLFVLAEKSKTSTIHTLLEEDVAELVWSVFATQACVADDPDFLVAASEEFLSCLPPVEKMSGSLSSYQALVVSGLMICARPAAWTPGLIPKLTEELGWTSEMHIQGFDFAPSVNRNAAIHDVRDVTSVNAWLLANFPRVKA